MSDMELVYSTDQSVNKHCPSCKKLVPECLCKKTVAINKSIIRAVLRIEKAHRGGKDVTVIDKLPADTSFLSDLAQMLKKKCGCGGTFKVVDNTGIVEMQGDKRDAVRAELNKQGIGCR
jgi:translation initiation factor 1